VFIVDDFQSFLMSLFLQTRVLSIVNGITSEFQEQIDSSLLLMDHFFFFSIHLELECPWIGLCVTAPKKLTFYYYYY